MSTISILPSLILAVTLSTTARAATIVVNSLADPGAPGICALRDAITAANIQARVNGCKAGSGNDTINFSVSGTIVPSNYFQAITDARLTIQGPITIGGGDFPAGGGGLLFVASGATVKFHNLTIANQNNLGAFENRGTLTIADSTITNNTRTSSSRGGTLTIINSTFADNAGLDILESGAITANGTLTIINSTFSGNEGTGPGAINEDGTLLVSNSAFVDNGSRDISAISTFGNTTIINSTFAGNTGGGGAIGSAGKMTVISSTFSGNSNCAPCKNGPGFPSYGDIDNAGDLTVKNSIFAGSTDGSGTPIPNCLGTITDAGYNISDDGSCGFAKTGTANNGDNVNPMLSSHGLTNNGGPTETIALSGDSPAIDAIPLADCTDQNGERLKTDQRGFPRPDAGERVCDIGAFETQDGCSQNQQGNNNCQ